MIETMEKVRGVEYTLKTRALAALMGQAASCKGAIEHGDQVRALETISLLLATALHTLGPLGIAQNDISGLLEAGMDDADDIEAMAKKDSA